LRSRGRTTKLNQPSLKDNIDHDLTLKEAALAKGVTEELFDPLALTRGGSADIPSRE